MRLAILVMVLLLSGCVTAKKCVSVELAEGGSIDHTVDGNFGGFAIPSGHMHVEGPGHYKSWLQNGCAPPPDTGISPPDE